jgi:hypothetical protein
MVKAGDVYAIDDFEGTMPGAKARVLWVRGKEAKVQITTSLGFAHTEIFHTSHFRSMKKIASAVYS